MSWGQLKIDSHAHVNLFSLYLCNAQQTNDLNKIECINVLLCVLMCTEGGGGLHKTSTVASELNELRTCEKLFAC